MSAPDRPLDREPPELEPTRSTPQLPDSLPVALQIDEVCDRFEAAWRTGQRPNISDYLPDPSAASRTPLFIELVRIDIEYRARSGDTRSLADYATEFPEFRAILVSLEPDPSLEATVALPTSDYRIGQYKLLNELGAGGFGSVWRALDEKLQRLVAIKLPRERFGQQVAARIFLREAQAAAQLDHPHIVQVYDHGEIEGQGFIVFEFVPGITLKQWLTIKEPDLRSRVQIVRDLADALAHAHDRHVVHRDLKPSNVLMDVNGKPRIADFGLARRTDGHSTIAMPGKMLGTVPYMSPEQVSGLGPGADGRSDIYSLGVILYQMLAGKVPFQGETSVVLHQIQHEPPVPPRARNKQVSADLETICLKALAKKPEERYQTGAELRDELDRYLEGRPILARRTAWPVRVWRWVQRNRLIAASVLFGGCATIGAAGYAVINQPPPDGRRPVALTSIPEGARLAIVPLDETTGRPRTTEILHTAGRTPLEERLLPGDYLLIAYLDDGRFHEVYRHVPFEGETAIGPQRHRRWTKPDSNGLISVPAVTIPELDVDDGMALLPGDGRFVVGKADSTIEPRHIRRVPAFYIDSREATIGQYRRIAGGDAPYDKRTPDRSDEHAVVLTWDWAVHLAELQGKRLPDEAEYEFAATLGGSRDFSWGPRDAAPADMATEFEPAGRPAFDRLPTDPPVYGLCSNVAEWTATWYTDYYPATLAKVGQVRDPLAVGRRIYRGGDATTLANNTSVAAEIRDPRRRHDTNRTSIEPGLGLRCVRSAQPRLAPEDFVTALPGETP